MAQAEKTKVIVGMSGGVDSSMAAALLLDQGYEVIGVTLQIWPSGGPETEKSCCSVSAIDDARLVAYLLGIPHYVLNFRSVFEEKVVAYFAESYFRGETPNPCLACNREIKFGELLRKARGLGAEYIATGHYARVQRDAGSGRFLLFKGVDGQKDQSYGLYGLGQEQLRHTLFPLGEYRKPQIREMAKARGLARVAAKPDSQEICFVPDNDYAEFLRRRAPEKVVPGLFVDREGRPLGKHRGIVRYTVGQRKGLGGTFGKPMFVLGFNPERNEVVLGEDAQVYTPVLWAEELNWIAWPEVREPVRVKAKIRYKAPPAPAWVIPEGSAVKVEFDRPQRAVTPGQAVVFYREDLVLGGGTIVSDPRGLRRRSI
ncbi:tRNA-specific 2-thiouridylase MnmA [mnmA] [Acididesulfobacillus acetoxydans]|uniref:tRNA-specific 2-thiouridylase MnmA n=1 Tax=Acididesulfobacillus acetoxydans TaxID=1561005 RepID=A0A8S0XBR9_9FIRM|nr:tRNA 2-thiouridine(34) synthase MnmA [Acididesulfobacillus acetoxydans]CAA7601546.1 tRNA-specific 2-thiouridylase MnmA [mnmA] [Acididesulfobacillus acetoxydans]CEJ07033.1 tRNA-specific 2-thiouridylase MnmA [Acididesulfobacillus acetoxydans]